MGCSSSTEVVVDPGTGQQKTKKKLGGAYPGQRRPQNAPYVPPANDFGKDGTATAHFIAYGGGNALTLVKQDGSHQPEAGKPQPEYIQVTLPDGVVAGQTIHVQAPDGRLNAIVVPAGFGPGSTFTVEFAPDEVEAAPAATAYAPQPTNQESTPYRVPPSTHAADDGFASGFNNSNYVPSAQATAVSEPYSTYNGASAYPSPPQYPKK